MKVIFFQVFKKRWFICLTLAVLTFFMNLFLWNETTQFIRMLPSLEIVKTAAQQNSYEFQYNGQVIEGAVPNIELSQAESERMYRLFSELFLKEKPINLYSNRFEFVNGGELSPCTDADLQAMFLEGGLAIPMLEDVMVRDMSDEQLQKLQTEIDRLSLPIEIVSFEETYQSLKSYYVGNVWFGLAACFFSLLIGVLLLSFILKAALQICQEEIKVLRILGSPVSSIVRFMCFLLLFPLVIGIVAFLVLIHTMGVGVLSLDYVYILLLNTIFIIWTVSLVRRSKWRINS